MMEPIRILVVEDDPDFQYLIQQSLSEQSDFALIAPSWQRYGNDLMLS